MRKRTLTYVVAGAVAAAAAGLYAGGSFSGGETTVAALAKETHFHGIAVDAADPSRVYLATHHGFYAVGADGKAKLISTTRDDFMGFTPHPANPQHLFASGHPAGGGNLGFIASTDGGKSWAKLSDGVGGPVDFHAMDVSKADPKVVYGIYRDLQRSADGGRTWTRIGPPPEGTIALAASSKNADALYAATQKGLLRSLDGGRSWQPAHVVRAPVTTVHVTHQGSVYAYVVGTGLVRTAEPASNWQSLSNDFGGSYVLHLAADPKDGGRLYAVTLNPGSHAAALYASRDGGASWTRFGSE
jgi:photosystem II stability/assembly factor-like uncharacterized protein